jgi:putative DNA primase/helicase
MSAVPNFKAADAARSRIDAALAEAPRPLPAELLPVDAFPTAALPEAMRPWVEDVSERMQCPADYVGVPLLVAAASLAGRHVAVRLRLRDDWSEFSNLWALIVGRPGVLKTPAMRAALAPLEALEAMAADAYSEQVAQHRAEAVIAKLRAEAMQAEARKRLRKDSAADVAELVAAAGSEADAPKRCRYIVNGATWEKLHEVMSDNPGGLLMTRDELSGWLHDMAREEQAEARSFFVAAWSGGTYVVDRIGRGTVTTRDMRLSIIGAIQPGPLAYIMKARAGRGEDGLIERFLVAWPDDPGEWRDIDRLPDGTAREQVRNAFARLDAASPWSVQAEQCLSPDGTADGMPFLRLSDEAREAFTDWRVELEARLRTPDAEASESALAKFRHHVPALALTAHVADGGAGPVSRPAMLKALALGAYFETHTRRLHASGQRTAVRAAKLILAKADSLGEMFTARDVYRPQWAGLTERETVFEALDLLVSHRWLDERSIDSGGRPTTVYMPRGPRRE